MVQLAGLNGELQKLYLHGLSSFRGSWAGLSGEYHRNWTMEN